MNFTIDITQYPPEIITAIFNKLPHSELLPLLNNPLTYNYVYNILYNTVSVFHSIPQNADKSHATMNCKQFIKFIQNESSNFPFNVIIYDNFKFFNKLFTSYKHKAVLFNNIHLNIDTSTCLPNSYLSLSAFSNIRTMSLSPATTSIGILSDTSGIRFPSSLTTLDLSHNSIKYLSNLPNLPNLKELNLSYNRISNIQMINENIPLNLQSLNLSANNLNTAFISKLDLPPTLQVLEMNDIRLHHDVHNLRLEHTNLEKISFKNCDISIIHPVAFPPTLIELDLSNNRIAEIPYMTASNLKTLNLTANALTDINYTILPDLINLILDENPLSVNKYFPESLVSLSLLNQPNSKQGKITNINNLPNLSRLVICNYNIPNIQYLNLPPTLTNIVMSHSKVNLGFTSAFPSSLTSLDLSYSDIKFPLLVSYAQQISLPPLEMLDISNIRLKNMSVFDIQGIKMLKSNGNFLWELAFIEDLEWLDISYNLFEGICIDWVDNTPSPIVSRSNSVNVSRKGSLGGATPVITVTGASKGASPIVVNAATATASEEAANIPIPIPVKPEPIFKNLKYLDISHNKLQHLIIKSKFQSHQIYNIFPQLETLNISNNQLTHLPPLPITLKTLIATNNDINQFTINFIPYKNLTSIDFSHNKLTSIQHTLFPPNLIDLNLSHNLLVEVQRTPFPPFLEVLDMSDNYIKQISEMCVPVTLKRLCVRDNYIDGVYGFGIPEGLVLELEGNLFDVNVLKFE